MLKGCSSKKKSIEDYPERVYILTDVPDDPNRVVVSNKNLNKEQCVGNICIRNLKITCYEDRGNITYTIRNRGGKKASGYLKLVFDNYTGYVIYDNLKSGKSVEGMTGYSGYDLRKIKTYKLEGLTDSDYYVFVNGK